VPKDKASWEKQYATGVWSYLGEITELSHYSVIVGYAGYLKPGGRVLDVGCGHGVLHDRWLPQGYDRYVGVDISEVAVSRLRERGLAHATFVAADAETYQPGEQFDVVVFNESITYFKDPEDGFARYVRALAPDGIAVVSCHMQSERAQAILRTLERTWRVLDATEVRQGDNSWRCVVFGPLT
jgi:SAM-dependent methyltransferase